LFKEGKGKNFIDQWIGEKELKKYDVDKLLFSAKKMLRGEYIEEIIPVLKANNEESVNQILHKLSPDIAEEIRLEGIKTLKANHKNEINKRIKNDESEEDIMDNCEMKYFDRDEIKAHIAFYKKYNEAPKGVEKDKLLLIGVPIVFIGLLILLFVRLPSGRPPSLAFLLVIYGGWNIYKAFTPPGVTELSDLNDKFK